MKYFFGILLSIVAVIWLAVFVTPDNNFHIIACDVGQGDAMLLTYKSFQVLIDGGPNNKVLNCLSKYLPFWDKTIEMVILTHPEADHFMGLVDVFKNYKINYFLASQVDNSTPSYSLLKSLVGGSQTKVINPYVGFKMKYGLIYLDILSPSQNLILSQDYEQTSNTMEKLGIIQTKMSLNTFSIIGLWRFENFRVLTTGDAPSSVLNELALTNPPQEIDLLKVAHHGSKTSLSQKLLNSYKPKIALISVGKNNIYRLPNQEVLDILKEEGTKIFRTDEIGDIEVITNGKNWWLK